jgi:hypothetical protein
LESIAEDITGAVVPAGCDGENCTLTCGDGTAGTDTKYSCESGEWKPDGTAISCEAVTCGGTNQEALIAEFGAKHYKWKNACSLKFGGDCSAMCDIGYTNAGDVTELKYTCKETKKLQGGDKDEGELVAETAEADEVLKCEKQCENVEITPDENGTACDGSYTNPKGSCVVSCNAGYVHMNKTYSCKESKEGGGWDDTTKIVCEAITCAARQNSFFQNSGAKWKGNECAKQSFNGTCVAECKPTDGYKTAKKIYICKGTTKTGAFTPEDALTCDKITCEVPRETAQTNSLVTGTGRMLGDTSSQSWQWKDDCNGEENVDFGSTCTKECKPDFVAAVESEESFKCNTEGVLSSAGTAIACIGTENCLKDLSERSTLFETLHALLDEEQDEKVNNGFLFVKGKCKEGFQGDAKIAAKCDMKAGTWTLSEEANACTEIQINEEANGSGAQAGEAKNAQSGFLQTSLTASIILFVAAF